MSHLAHRTFRPKAPHRILYDSRVVEATVSPAHLVFMHGLFGSNRNFASVCATMAGLDSDQRLMAEAKLGVTTHHDVLIPPLSAPVAVPKAAAPRVYACSAFDWRNHGASPHNPNMNLNGLSEDLVAYVEEYSTRLRYEQLTATKMSGGVECEPTKGAPASEPPSEDAAVTKMGKDATPEAPLPVILVAHSMGAMVMMHWLWREHVNIWAHKVFLGEDSPYLVNNVFHNQHYHVIGAVVIDMAPTQRPESFNDTIRIIDFLPEAPLHELHSPQEVEKWLLANGPKDVFNQHNIFQIRYHLSNIDYSDPAHPHWGIGLREIIGGLHKILWEEGGIDSMQQARDALMVANRRRIAQRKNIWERPTKFDAFPTYFVFGKDSHYNTELAHKGIFRHFYQPSLVELDKADHFLFMRHKSSFIAQLRNFCYDAELKAKIIDQAA